MNALPQVSEQALTEAAQPLEDLEEHRRSVAELARTLDAVRGLLDVYRAYCVSDLSKRVTEGQQRLGARRACNRDEQRSRRAAQAAAGELARLDAEIETLARDQRRLRREIGALEKSQAYQQGQQLEGLRQLVGNLAKQRETAAARLHAAQHRVEEDALELGRARQTGRADREALNASLARAGELARRCGLDRRPPGPVSLAESDLAAGSELTEPELLNLAPADRELVDTVSAVGRRRSDAGQAKQALEDERAATRELDQAEATLAHATASADQAAERVAEHTRRLAAARSDWYEEIRLWAAAALESIESAGVAAPQTAAQAARRPDAKGDMTDPEALRSQLHAEAEGPGGPLARRSERRRGHARARAGCRGGMPRRSPTSWRTEPSPRPPGWTGSKEATFASPTSSTSLPTSTTPNEAGSRRPCNRRDCCRPAPPTARWNSRTASWWRWHLTARPAR